MQKMEQDWQDLQAAVGAFVRAYPGQHQTLTRWRSPVMGVAAADDPLYTALSTKIVPGHALPEDLVPGARSVIVFFIPFSRAIIQSNIPGEESSREWDYACIETNQLIADLCGDLHRRITGMGYQASNLPPTYQYDEQRLVSRWSHKSSAYIAGIGTFGYHHLLITREGCCGRLGSVITDMPLPVTPRPKEEYCLYWQKGTCLRCVARCVNAAFAQPPSREAYDRFRCNAQIYDKVVPHYPIGDGDACGKCMCGVPCAFTRPVR